jgi:divinyl chlorophyllide a 8-vinyl-reductase
LHASRPRVGRICCIERDEKGTGLTVSAARQSDPHLTRSPQPRRVLLLGATGTIGRATLEALAAKGHEVVCFGRSGATGAAAARVSVRRGQVTDPLSLRRDGFRGEPFDVLVSCLASRTGVPREAWAIDHAAHVEALAAAQEAGVRHVVLLSAICVQKPLLEFQKAKLAFEQTLLASGVTYTIVRPTAFFKSLSGQVARVQAGKPYLLFGAGTATACKPISDRDLARYLADCLDEPARHNRVLPIGGPGPALTPRAIGDHLFELLGQPARFRRVPIAMLDGIVVGLAGLGRLNRALADKAELARIGRYYATESMLVLDPATGRYDADATPSFGSDTLFEHHARLVRGEAAADLGAHAVF